jgi:hypothetical protein
MKANLLFGFVAMNVFVNTLVQASGFSFFSTKALGAGANTRATVGTLLSVGWLHTFYAFVKESNRKLETHVRFSKT